jgi:8-oxo-dGTP pyrophosphatase MutT (NUDIX family)
MLKPFKVLSEEQVFDVPERCAVIEAHLETPEGKQVRWSFLTGRDIAVVLPLDDKGNVYIKQEWRLNRKDFVWEVVSGMVEVEHPTDDQVRETALRELQEEVGMRANTLEKLITVYPFNHMRSKIHLFLATDLEASKLPGDEHEILQVSCLPFEDAYELVVKDKEPTAQNALIFSLVRASLPTAPSSG